MAIQFVLTLVSARMLMFLVFDRAVLERNDGFSISVVSTKIWSSGFLKKVFVFQKICFKVNVLKALETFTGFHIKTCRSLKRRAILKIHSTVFYKNLCFFCWLENKNSKKKRFRMLTQKPTQVLP